MSPRRGILVSGAHRSGSTWVGRMLAHSHEVQYIHEPFNLKCRSGICRAEFDQWYSYVDSTVARHGEVHTALTDTLTFRYSLVAELKDVRNVRDILRLVRDYGLMERSRFLNLRPLMKDPLALFSAEWLSDTFDMDVVILIRHPAAFVSSLKVKGWSFDFSHFLHQPILMERYLEPFRDEINMYTAGDKGIIDQATLLWRITHHTIQKYQQEKPNWIFVRHEDVSRNPLAEFSKIYQQLDLNYTKNVQLKISSASGNDNPKETSRNIHNVNRDSSANIWNWQNRLTQGEIHRIYEGVGTIGQFFYGDDDWGSSILVS